MARAASAREPAPVGGAASATPCCCSGLVRRVPQGGLIGLSNYSHSGMVISVRPSPLFSISVNSVRPSPLFFVTVISVRPSPLFSFSLFFFSNWLIISKKPLEVFFSPEIKTGFLFPPEIPLGTPPYQPGGREMPIACGANQTARKKMATMTVKLFYNCLISNIHQRTDATHGLGP